MKHLIDAADTLLLQQLASADYADRLCLCSPTQQLTYAECWARVQQIASALRVLECRSIALIGDNSIEWVLLDLAAMLAKVCLVPVPPFFSAAQIEHLLQDSGADLCVVQTQFGARLCGAEQREGLAAQLGFKAMAMQLPHLDDFMLAKRAGQARFPQGTGKITYTSGTTAQPKGVCLSLEQQLAVAESLADRMQGYQVAQHLCILPLAVLLENVAGVYVPLLAGACVQLSPLAELGFRGSSTLDLVSFSAALTRLQPDSLILTPELLKALIGVKQTGIPLPTFRFLALGGGHTAPALIEQATRLGLPVYEGYGLSECASVVALNPLDAARPGSVGKPLPHIAISLAADGEVLIRGNQMLGYLNAESPSSVDGWLPTGDFGRFDHDGYLYLLGRKKNTIVTGFGRNVSPEWLEAELTASALIRQAWVVGAEDQPLTACLYAVESVSDAQIAQWLAQLNSRLPDYAQLRHWCRLTQPLSNTNDTLTPNGRLRRHVLHDWFGRRAHPIFGASYELLPDSGLCHG